MKVTDALLGAFFVLFGVVVLWQASQFPDFAGQPYGAALLPSLLAAGFVVSGAVLILRDLRARRSVSGPWVALVPDLRAGGTPALLAVLGNVLAHIGLSPLLGFLPVAVIGLSALFVVLRVPVVQAVLIALPTTIVCWWLFAGLLRVPLPRGLMGGVL